MDVTAQAFGLSTSGSPNQGAGELEGLFDAAKTNTASKSNPTDTEDC